MPLGRTELMENLGALAISTTTVEHGAAFTAVDSIGAAAELPGAHTKNLFLKSDDGERVLVIAEASTVIDLKFLARKLGVGRLSFASPDMLMTALGVTPGSVSAFSIANDIARRVKVVIDADLKRRGSLNCHPLVNTATTNIAFDDLLKFIRAHNHDFKIMALGK